jgi:hypothetical protein
MERRHLKVINNTFTTAFAGTYKTLNDAVMTSFEATCWNGGYSMGERVGKW